MASKNATEYTPSQLEAIAAAKAALGVKFLPAQTLRRIVEPKSTLKTLGATKRRKAAKVASREAAAKQAASTKK